MSKKSMKLMVANGVLRDLKAVDHHMCECCIFDTARSKLDPKLKKCYFIGYGATKFGYRLWDDQRRKIIDSRNVVFNEDVLYKDKLEEEGSKLKELVVVDFGDILAPELQKDWTTTEEHALEESNARDENDDSGAISHTPVMELRRLSRIIGPPVRFPPDFNYILFTGKGEHGCYEEAIEVDESIKWEVAKKNKMAYMDSVPYVSAIDSMMYMVVCTRPDIAYAVGVVSGFMGNQEEAHWEAAKWILGYLKGSSSPSLYFRKSEMGLQGYADNRGDSRKRRTADVLSKVVTIDELKLCSTLAGLLA